MIGLTVVGNPAATVMTSSPGMSLRRRAMGGQARKSRQIGGRSGIDQ